MFVFLAIIACWITLSLSLPFAIIMLRRHARQNVPDLLRDSHETTMTAPQTLNLRESVNARRSTVQTVIYRAKVGNVSIIHSTPDTTISERDHG